MPVMSAILVELALMPCIVSTTRPTAVLPLCAMSAASRASSLACLAFSLLRRTVAVSSSMLAAVSSSDAACSSVRRLRSALPAAISADAPAMLPLLWRTRETISVRRSFMSRSADSKRPVSSRATTAIRLLRSPRATVCATSTAVCMGRVMERVISSPPAAASTTAAMDMTISRLRCAA